MMHLSQTESTEFLYELGKDGWHLFSYLNVLSSNNVVSITQVQLAERLGVSDKYVQRHLKTLTAFDVNGQPLVTSERTADGNIYRLLPIALGHFVGGQTSPISSNNNDLKDSKDLVEIANGQVAKIKKATKAKLPTDEIFNYFRTTYEARYGTEYKVGNFAREKGQIRNLIKKYDGDADLVKAIIDVVMRLYDNKWKSQQFTRPTIGALISWVAAQAEPFARANLDDKIFENAVITTEDGSDGLDVFDAYEKRWGM